MTATAETLEIAQRYLEAHLVPEEQFGLGYVLDLDQYFLFARPNVMLNGGLIIDGIQGYLDCRTMAIKLHQDILLNNPELQPVVASYDHGETHNWVEIMDPKTGEIIQIDPTPWYARLNPGHVRDKTEANAIQMTFSQIPLPKEGGLPFSVTGNSGKFFTTYFSAMIPNCSLEEKIAELKMQRAGLPDSPEKLHYHFSLGVVKDSGFGTQREKVVLFYLDVKDVIKLQQHITTSGLDDLINLGAIEIGIEYSLDGGPSTKLPADVTLLKEICSEAHAEFFAEFEKALPKLLKLLKKTIYILPIYHSNDSIDVNDGMVKRDFFKRPFDETGVQIACKKFLKAIGAKNQTAKLPTSFPLKQKI